MQNESMNAIFGKNLKGAREKADFTTAKAFAASFGKEGGVDILPYTTYSAYEQGKKQPKFEMLMMIANKLGISVDDLLCIDAESRMAEEERIKRRNKIKHACESVIAELKNLNVLADIKVNENNDDIELIFPGDAFQYKFSGDEMVGLTTLAEEEGNRYRDHIMKSKIQERLKRVIQLKDQSLALQMGYKWAVNLGLCHPFLKGVPVEYGYPPNLVVTSYLFGIRSVEEGNWFTSTCMKNMKETIAVMPDGRDASVFPSFEKLIEKIEGSLPDEFIKCVKYIPPCYLDEIEEFVANGYGIKEIMNVYPDRNTRLMLLKALMMNVTGLDLRNPETGEYIYKDIRK